MKCPPQEILSNATPFQEDPGRPHKFPGHPVPVVLLVARRVGCRGLGFRVRCLGFALQCCNSNQVFLASTWKASGSELWATFSQVLGGTAGGPFGQPGSCLSRKVFLASMGFKGAFGSFGAFGARAAPAPDGACLEGHGSR